MSGCLFVSPCHTPPHGEAGSRRVSQRKTAIAPPKNQEDQEDVDIHATMVSH